MTQVGPLQPEPPREPAQETAQSAQETAQSAQETAQSAQETAQSAQESAQSDPSKEETPSEQSPETPSTEGSKDPEESQEESSDEGPIKARYGPSAPEPRVVLSEAKRAASEHHQRELHNERTGGGEVHEGELQDAREEHLRRTAGIES